MSIKIEANELKDGIEYERFYIEYDEESAEFKREDLHVGPDNEKIIKIRSIYHSDGEVYRLNDKFRPMEEGGLEEYESIEEALNSDTKIKLIGRDSPNTKDFVLNSIQSIKSLVKSNT